MPVPPLRLAVLGCADIAVRRMLPALPAVPGLRLTVVASRRRNRAAAVTETFGGEPVEGYESALASDDVDAVYIPLPAALHRQWIERALAAGKHVLAEKPMTLRHEDTVRLLADADARGLVLHENVMFVHHSAHRRVAGLVADGAIGRPHLFSGTFTAPGRKPDDIRLQPALGGGSLCDNGVYPLRAAVELFGPEWTVAGAALRVDPSLGVDLGGGALLRRHDGLIAQATFGLDHAYRCRYEIVGSTGRISLDRAFTPPAGHRPELVLDRDGRRETMLLDADDQVANTLAAFVEAVRDGGPNPAGPAHQAALVDAVRSHSG
jgi:NDP-hexose-3-ketoreductase